MYSPTFCFSPPWRRRDRFAGSRAAVAAASVLFTLGTAAPPVAVGGPLGLVLPTANKAIFSEHPEEFYQYTDRTFEGVRSKPWSGGRYGFVRDQKRTAAGIVFTKFHEGIDIRPVKRDKAGEPLDDVFAIADGKVVYVSTVSSRSNYGNYVVIQHDWGEGPFYSLYAHLKSVMIETGQPVKAGQRVARMGYTGAGINRERAHVHVELAMMLSSRFQGWYDKHFTTRNWHGNYNGFNLAGIDLAGLYHSHRDNPGIAASQFLSLAAPYYKVAVPNRGTPELLKRYPWLGRDMAKADGNRSWVFTFADTGVPLAIEPGDHQIAYPAVVWVKSSRIDHAYNTLARINGTGSKAALTASGSRYVQLVTGAF